MSWTLAQKRDVKSYEPGHQLHFVRSNGVFHKGDIAEVISSEGTTLHLRGPDGREVAMPPRTMASSIDVGQKRNIQVSPGDWLLLQSNTAIDGNRFINGERVQLKAFTREGLELQDGRTLPSGYRTFTHGYAVTSHSSQGRTVDEVLLVASSRSFAAVGQEQFYVSISRARERVHIFTDDADSFRARVTGTRERKAALELTGLRETLATLGHVRVHDSHSFRDVATDLHLRGIRALRNVRPTRLSPVQRIIRSAAEIASWLGQRIGRKPEETPTQTVSDLAPKPIADLQPKQKITMTHRIPLTKSHHRRSKGISI